MTEQHNAQLQRIFDERLMRVLPPPRVRRERRRGPRLIAATLAVVAAGTSLALAADVNRKAEAAGESCASVLARVDVWWETVRNGTTAQQLEFKRQAADLVGQSCTAKGELAGPPSGKRPDAGPVSKPASAAEVSPRCIAAKAEAQSLVAAQPNGTEADYVALKRRISALLEQACAP